MFDQDSVDVPDEVLLELQLLIFDLINLLSLLRPDSSKASDNLVT